ncbi:aminopeptidase N [Homoserinimonas sp. OAct 916]|uniref:aminopeptidase N n=1 Tax=Homoserinimonas sp. OAct 916 TaxID=2211450 RepID=UPI000DBE9E3D|nr:aminopeptidase N [Homoserinimonas sp. OAct 916]
MPGENLTRDEARERATLVNVSRYEIALDFTTGPETFLSTTTVAFTASAGASTFIDAITRTVHSVTLNGVELDPAAVSDGVRIQLDDLADDNVLKIVADAVYMNTGEGMHRFVDPVDQEVYLYSQFEVPDSRRVFAVFEQPDLKATFQFTITAPAKWQVISNSPMPAPVAVRDGVARWEFAPTPPLPSYITAVVAGPYIDWRSELTSSDGRVIPLGVFARASMAEFMDADYIFDITRKGFTFFEENFDYPYPFEKYDQMFVPEYNMGAMENAGAVTFTETYVFRSKVTDAIKERRVVTILHELAHMWFGDLVTMRWWNDLWLNESFAEYASVLATAEVTEWHEAWTTFAAMEKAWAYEQDQLPSTHPIVATINDLDDVQANFDGITYAKGASVLKQLAFWVGQEAFMAGVASYFTKHEWGNTELPDLLTELSATSGRDLEAWSRLWLETAGVNTLRPEVATDETGVITSFTVLQEAPDAYPTLRPHRLAIGFYTVADGALVRTERFELDVDGARTDVPELIGRSRPDLILVNDDDLAYAKVRLDDLSLAAATAHLSDIQSPLARALVLGAAWDAMRDAETRPREFVDLVLANVATETESTTMRTVLGQVVLTARRYVDPTVRADTLARIGDALWEFAQGAEAGSDAQFQFVTHFAQVACSPAHTQSIQGLFDGTITLDGLTVDTDLRWVLLNALVLNGVAGHAEIEQVLATDTTANGNQAAARAAATIPTVQAKQAAFDSIVTDDSAPNAIVRATAMGILHVNEQALLEPLVERYFASINDIWANRSYHIAETLVEGLYPAPLASPALRDATQKWLDENPDQVPAFRRLVIENLAGVTRALAAQARDA